MLLFDLSDTLIKVARYSRRFLTGETITAYTKAGLKEGLVRRREIVNPQDLAKEVKSVLQKNGFKFKAGEECAFVLDDERTFTLRLDLPKTRDGELVSNLVEKEVESFIPESPSSQIRVFKVLGAEKISGETQFAAVNRELFARYLDLFNSLELKPVLAVPESYAVHALLAPKVKGDEILLYLNMEEETTDAVVLDKLGVFHTFTEPIENVRLIEGLKKVTSFFKERWAKSPSRIIVGGEGASSVDKKELGKSLDLEVLSAEDLFKKYPFHFGLGAATINKLELLSVLGLALLIRQKNPLNFVRS